MRKILKLIFKIIAIYLFCFPFSLNAQQQENLRQEAMLLRKTFLNSHYAPRTLDDKFSEQVFNRFINSLDPSHIYFTADNIKELSVYKFQLDDEFEGASWKFLPLATAIFQQRLLLAERTFQEILQKPFDFTIKESIAFVDKDSLTFAADDKEYLKRWQKYMKYKTLSHIVDINGQNDSLIAGKKDYDFLSKEPEMRKKVGLIERRHIRKILEDPAGYENYIGSIFFNSFVSCFDAHSSYMSKTEWQNFKSGLSTESYSFGIDIDENKNGDIVIERLVPGGPAWKSNELHKGDILMVLKWADKPEMDLTGAGIREVKHIIEASNSERMYLTVKMANGQIKTVSLLKEKIRDDENIVKSFILKGEKKIGYISLPGFYTEWENNSGRGCANDVAKEIVKLREENIDGIILDIRYNGGGALTEGQNLAGIFINEGPLFMMQSSDGKAIVKKDLNRGTVYDGPMLVMVNGQSASASELLASTLQDYNRAVIVGSPTFGKATGQGIMPLDTSVRSLSEFSSPYGIVTVTLEKLYRVTGKSAQLYGVQPDVHLPDIFEILGYHESSMPFALPSDSINKKVYFTPLASLPVKELAEKSSGRIQSSKSFQTIQKLMSDPVVKQKMNEDLPLSVEAFRKKAVENNLFWDALKDACEQHTILYKAENVNFDKNLIELDTYSKEINDIQIANLESDIYLEESFQILANLINLTP
jgi:carboxyl-terminal processing protease